MNTEHTFILHIVSEVDFRSHISNGQYEPESLKTEGFIHCTSGKTVLLAVAEDYYAGVKDRLLVLKIDLPKITNEVRFESPSEISGGGQSHTMLASDFPHIYGKLNLSAIVGIGVLDRNEDRFIWPKTFDSPNIYFKWSNGNFTNDF